MNWTERNIGRALVRQVFQRKHLVLVPNCTWTGDEIDLLVVTPDLRIVDVEIKISRADLKADWKKDKWYHSWDWRIDGPWKGRADKGEYRRREWPRKAWKHYYCMPESVWTLGPTGGDKPVNPASGIILLSERDGNPCARVIRRAKPCRDAKPIHSEDVLNLARLASLRMWDAFDELDAVRRTGA